MEALYNKKIAANSGSLPFQIENLLRNDVR
jgi:hypothetical protein